MQFKYVTSMNRDQYGKFGEEMLESFCQYWPQGQLHVYTEDEFFPFQHERVEYHDLLTVDGCASFLYALSPFPVFSGEIQGRKLYTHNINAFSRKVFSQIDAAVDWPGYLFWVDSDVITYDYIPSIFLEAMMSDAWMAVMKRKDFHMCSSFVGWDCGHDYAAGWWQHYLTTYTSGAVFTLPQWDDAFVLEKVIESMPQVRDIAAGFEGEGPYNVFDMVFEGMARHDKGVYKHANRYGHLLEIVNRAKPRSIVEVGTWNGERALQMLQIVPEAAYYGFDLFEEASDETDEAEKNVKKHYSLEDVALKLQGLEATLYCGDTKETFTQFAEEHGQSIELVFIDGGHSVETIRSDLAAARKVISPGGLIVMDDYYTEMPDEELRQFGAQEVLRDEAFTLLPTQDYVKGGGKVQMAVIQC